jgi:hypothetical protein
MSRAQDFDAFIGTQPDFAAIVAKVRAERNVVDKTLTWARLKYAYLDYNPYRILGSILEGQPIGDLKADEDTKLRYGWTRWEEIRQQIDSVDQWLKNPQQANSLSILRSVMVTIPDQIDIEFSAWSRNKALVIQKTKELGKNVVDAAGSAVTTIAAPLIVLALAGTAYNWSKRK